MAISLHPSIVTLPEIEKPYPSILDFLASKFPAIDRKTWKTRIQSGKVLTEKRAPIALSMPYIPRTRLLYFREVEKEIAVPFTETLVCCNDHLLVACKPHFLPVTPAGPFVNECLLHRLKKKTGNPDLSPINRIDRETAGIVLFSMNPETRGRYQALFMTRKVEKSYEAVAKIPGPIGAGPWSIKNRIVKGDPWFRMKIVPGRPNAISTISLVQTRENLGLFRLNPVTGKKHQLRLHLCEIGVSILNDRYYPTLLPQTEPDFSSPLQLLAKKICFKDPVTEKMVTYESGRKLSAWQTPFSHTG
jgi:tRNA pseudouridine32 synthase/23S rRNA pseudouridine746 synthase